MVRVRGCPQSGFIRVEPNLAEICTNLRHFRYYWSLTRLKLESENETRVRKLTQLTRVTRLDLQTLVDVPLEAPRRHSLPALHLAGGGMALDQRWSDSRERSWPGAREGSRAFFKGAGVNVVRGVAGAGVLAGSDKLKKIYITRKELRNV